MKYFILQFYVKNTFIKHMTDDEYDISKHVNMYLNWSMKYHIYIPTTYPEFYY